VLPCKQGSSLGIRVYPFTGLPHRSSTPSRTCRSYLRPPGTTRRGHVPSSRFLSALTACSERELRVYCAPQPVMGFAVFQVILTSPPQAGLSFVRPSPTAETPFGVFPSSIAAPRHRGRYLPVITAPSRSIQRSCKLREWLLAGGHKLLPQRAAPPTNRRRAAALAA
jgi:hypothetical protein